MLVFYKLFIEYVLGTLIMTKYTSVNSLYVLYRVKSFQWAMQIQLKAVLKLNHLHIQWNRNNLFYASIIWLNATVNNKTLNFNWYADFLAYFYFTDDIISSGVSHVVLPLCLILDAATSVVSCIYLKKNSSNKIKCTI